MSISLRLYDRRLVGSRSLFCRSGGGGGRSCLHRLGDGNIDIDSKRGWLRGHRGSGSFKFLLGRFGNLLGLRGSLLWLAFIALNGLFLEEAEDVIENKVTIGLLGEEEGLNELLPRLATIRHFTNDLNDDTPVGRRLCID